MLLSYSYLYKYQPFQHETWLVAEWILVLGKKKDCMLCGQNISQQELCMVYLQYYITSYHTHNPVITIIVQAIFVNKARGNVKVSAYNEYVLCKPYALKIL